MIYSIFRRLTDPALPKRGPKMGTQNVNESCNSHMWQRCPKTKLSSRISVDTTPSLAIWAFNCGAADQKMFVQ